MKKHTLTATFKKVCALLLAVLLVLAIASVSAEELPVLSGPLPTAAPQAQPENNAADSAGINSPLPAKVNKPEERDEGDTAGSSLGYPDSDVTEKVTPPPKTEEKHHAEQPEKENEKDIFFTIRFFNDANVQLRAVQVKKGRALVEAPEFDLVKTDCYLAGWLLRTPAEEEVYTFTPYSFGAPVNADLELVPNWKAIGDEDADEADVTDPPQNNNEAPEPGDPAGENEKNLNTPGDAADNNKEASPQEDPKMVIIATTAFGEVFPGDIITLYSIVKGYDEIPYTLAWQYDSGDGWKTAQTGGATFNFVLTEDNYAWEWRLELIASIAEVNG
ncbi:MAG: hypothetical protein FWF47_03395 [Clostridia bacterium]|nr:hypothetical protein [Clostridia bacterium]